MNYVLVTGASQGIGAQIAKDLDRAGYGIVLLGRKKETLLKVSQNLKNPSVSIAIDLADPSTWSSLENQLQELDGPICGLVNNAGIFVRKPLEETSEQDWSQLFKTNLLGPSLLTNKVLPFMKKSSAERKFIINISSTAAERPVQATGAYGGLKLAFTHLSKVLALELAPDKICVNVISPGIIDTPIHSLETLPKETQQQYQDLQPLGRVGQPKDISSLVVHLASEESQWITGSNFIVDGGLSLL